MSYNLTQLNDKIFYVEDFILPEEMQHIDFHILNLNGWNLAENLVHWTKNLDYEVECKKCNEKAITEQVKDIQKRIIKCLGIHEKQLRQTNIVLQYKSSDNSSTRNGMLMNYHTDNYAKGSSEHVIQGTVLYLNDNFEGGEIHYKNFDLKIKPKKGMLVVHGGGDDCEHGVLPLLSGNRFVVTGFIYDYDYAINTVK